MFAEIFIYLYINNYRDPPSPCELQSPREHRGVF